MSLQDPIAVYYAKTNVEAMTLCHILKQSGIEAHLMEDQSLAGLWMGGTAPNIHRPKVWVDRADEAAATAILKKYEQSRYDHEPERAQRVGDETLVQALCEECGESSMFSSRILGSVQECPRCGKFMDVESAEDRAEMDQEWLADDPGDDEETDPR